MIYAKINLEIFKLNDYSINRNIILHITSIYINTKYIYKFITPKTLYITYYNIKYYILQVFT